MNPDISIKMFNDSDGVIRVLITKQRGRRVDFRTMQEYARLVEPEQLVAVSMALGIRPVELDVMLVHAARHIVSGERSLTHGNN